MEENELKKSWKRIYSKHLKNCYAFWLGQENDMALSLEKAINEVRNLKHNPFKPKGEAVDKETLDEFCKYWEGVKNELLAGIQDGRYFDDGIRTCSVCGLPMKQGYVLDEYYACDDDCCLDVYDGDKAKMEEELSHAEENDARNYWTEWESIFFE